MKKILIASSFLLVFLIISCGGNNYSRNSRMEDTGTVDVNESNSNSNDEKNAEEFVKYVINESESGSEVYEIFDATDQQWILILNKDETATLQKRGGEKYYGNWEMHYEVNLPTTTFPDHPQDFNFPKKDNLDTSSLHMIVDTKNGFIYGNESFGPQNYKSKNPGKRLEIKKIK